MTPPNSRIPAADPARYAEWCGEEDLQLFPIRNEEEARLVVELVPRLAPVSAAASGLDLPCGAGRHLRELAVHGAHAVGPDLPFFLLGYLSDGMTPVVRGDVRVPPFATGSCDLITCFSTSFGFVGDPANDLAVLDAGDRVIQEDGLVALVFLNAHRERAAISSPDERPLHGRYVRLLRTLTGQGRVIEKGIETLGATDSIPFRFQQRVRLYSPTDPERMLRVSGLPADEQFGSYHGHTTAPEASRAILIGRAA